MAASLLAIFQTIQLSNRLDEDSVDHTEGSNLFPCVHAGLINYCHWKEYHSNLIRNGVDYLWDYSDDV